MELAVGQSGLGKVLLVYMVGLVAFIIVALEFTTRKNPKSLGIVGSLALIAAGIMLLFCFFGTNCKWPPSVAYGIIPILIGVFGLTRMKK
jgi:positive regulator of sigma E activity